MSFEGLLIHTGRLYRRTIPASEFGTPEPGTWAPAGDAFPCRLSNNEGFETPDRAGQRPQRRTAKVYLSIVPEPPRRGDRVKVDQFPGPLWEIDHNRIVYDGSGPHHWELSVSQIDGDGVPA